MMHPKPNIIAYSYRYKWLILTMGFLANFCISGIGFTCMPVLFKEISLDFGLSLVQLGTLWSAFVIGQAIFFLPGGAIGDRLGIRTTVFLGCMIAAISYAGRGLSNNFEMLAIFMFISAPAFTFIQPNVTKTVSMWFKAENLGFVNGLTITGFASGATLGSLITATWLSPTVGGWQNIMYLYGFVSLTIGILWVLSVKEIKQDGMDAEIQLTRIPFKEAFRKIVHTRDVWFMLLAFTGIMSCLSPVLGYMAVYFENIGLEKSLAHTLFAVNFGSAAVGNLLLPSISDRIGLRKPVYIIGILIGCTSIFLFQVVGDTLLWIAVLGQGIGLAGVYSLSSTMVVQIRGIGPAYAGTALGLIMTITHLIAFISPIVGAKLAEIEPGRPFVLWAFLPMLAIISIIFIEETGARAKHRKVNPAKISANV